MSVVPGVRYACCPHTHNLCNAHDATSLLARQFFERTADTKYNEPEISHEFARELSAEHHALPQRTIICASGAYFFTSDMSFFILNMKTHVSYGITGRIKSSQRKLIARIIFHCKSATDFERK
jgi:hypothetical protein